MHTTAGAATHAAADQYLSSTRLGGTCCTPAATAAAAAAAYKMIKDSKYNYVLQMVVISVVGA